MAGEQHGREWHGRGMASVNQARPHCVNQMGKTHSKSLATRHGMGTARARHVMCESALNGLRLPGADSRLLQTNKDTNLTPYVRLNSRNLISFLIRK